MSPGTDAREMDLALLVADRFVYTALTKMHGVLIVSAMVRMFCELARASLEPEVVRIKEMAVNMVANRLP